MKSKIKVIVIGLIILCLAGVYAIIDKAVSIYDTSCDTSALKKVRNGKFFKIKFDRIDATKDKKYMLEMSVQECPTGSIRVFYTPGSNENATLIYASQTIEGVGVIRSLTHRFDLETFIVTLCFAAYIILFMRWLYKLFE